jgi:hypothetical protein
MSNVGHTVSELIDAVGETYQAIDIRSVAIRKDDSWLNCMAAIRLTYEDVDTAKTRLVKLSQRFPPVQTKLLRIDSFVRPFKDFPDLCLELSHKGVLQMDGVEFQLRQRPDLLRDTGYIQWGYSCLRPFDGRAWPAITRDFDPGGNNPLFEGQFNREAHLLGYGDVFEAANALCELRVSLQQDRGSDLSVCFPVFANISGIQVKTPERRIEVDVLRHKSFSGIRAVACVRGHTVLADEPFREHIVLSESPAADTRSQIVSAQGIAQVADLDPDNDWLEIRLVHPRLGEIKKDSNYVRTFIPPTERNILLGALRQFCRGKTLDELLVRAYNVQTVKLTQSPAFELHVSWLLGMFGLSTVVLGDYERLLAPDTEVQRVSIDILAANQRSKLLLLVSCTLGTPKEEDIGNLRHAREILAREVFAETGVRVVPILFTSSMGCPSYYKSEDHFDSVPVIDADSMKTLLGFLDSGQENRFFEFLANPTFGLSAFSQLG